MMAVDACVGSYLKHYGTKGMKWRQHGEGKRWQSQAVYANGQTDPDAKEKGSKIGNVAKGIKTGVVNAASAVKKEVGDYHRAKTPYEIKQFIGKLDERYAKAKGNVSKFGLKAEKTLATVKLGKKVRRAGTRHIGAAGTVAGTAAAAATMKLGPGMVKAANYSKQVAYLSSKGLDRSGYLASSFLNGAGLPQVKLIAPGVVPALSGAMFALGIAANAVDTGLSYRRGRQELNKP